MLLFILKEGTLEELEVGGFQGVLQLFEFFIQFHYGFRLLIIFVLFFNCQGSRSTLLLFRYYHFRNFNLLLGIRQIQNLIHIQYLRCAGVTLQTCHRATFWQEIFMLVRDPLEHHFLLLYNAIQHLMSFLLTLSHAQRQVIFLIIFFFIIIAFINGWLLNRFILEVG